MPKKDELATQQTTSIELTPSAKFSTYALREFGTSVAGEVNATDYQRQLIQGYFIAIDRSLKTAEENRIKKNESNTNKAYNNDLAISWNTVNMKELVLDVVHYAKIGLDMMQPNHLTAIPYKNKKTNLYDVTFIKGYAGIQYTAEKYALNKPKNITTELVYSSDIFKPLKKNAVNEVEGYEFEIINPFDRGEIIGGFGYIEFDDPKKNKLIIMTTKDIEKRKPQYASAEFWGGKAKRYEGNKQIEVEIEGWKDEMYMKTLKRFVYSDKNIEIDPKKIDDNYQYMKMAESRYVEMETHALIEEQANTEEFIVPEIPKVEVVKVEVVEKAEKKPTESKQPSWVEGDAK